MDRAIRAHGLRTEPHLDGIGRGDAERTIFIFCRPESTRADHDLIYALLDTLGWRPDRARLGRVTLAYDITRLIHTSGARVTLIIKLPFGQPPQWEAA